MKRVAVALTALAIVLSSCTTPTLEQRMDTIRCEQWGERFDNPCN